MSRIGWLLIALLSLLLVIGWYFLAFDPTRDDIEAVRAETDRVEIQAADQRALADRLRTVRENAPEAEASLSAGRQLIPDEPAIPALFRQLQQASDDAGMRLLTITPTEPAQLDITDELQVTSIGVSLSLQGSYFQMVDLARRIEDPTITPRALRWETATIGLSDFPNLTINVAGQVFSRDLVQIPSAPELDDAAPPEDDALEEGAEPDANDIEPEGETEEVSP